MTARKFVLTCTPGAFYMKAMLQATDALPLNFGFTGKGNTAKPEGLAEQILAGAIGLKNRTEISCRSNKYPTAWP